MSTPPDPAWPAPPHAQQTEHREPLPPAAEHNAHEHTRLALIIALSIAVVSVLGAVVGWRAEVHASRASRYEQDSVATSIALVQVRGQGEAEAEKAASSYAHYARLQDEADELSPGACNGGARDSLAQLDAGVLCQTQVQFSDYSGDGYVTKGTFELDRYAGDYVTAQQSRNPLDPEAFSTSAENERSAEHNMLYLSLFLVLALALLTLARLGKEVASRLVLAIPGWLLVAGCATYLVTQEM